MAKKDNNKQHKSSILGTMFDFNGDGYTDTFEAMTAYKEYEKRMRKKHNYTNGEFSIFSDDDDNW